MGAFDADELAVAVAVDFVVAVAVADGFGLCVDFLLVGPSKLILSLPCMALLM